MAEKRKRKIDDECRQFQEEWSLKYFFIKSGEKALCVICNETVAVMKEYNLRRHHQSKHQEKYAQLEGKVRAEKFSKLQNQLTSQRTLFSKSSNENESLTKASYKVAYVLAKSGKPFTDGEVVKECLLEVAEELCPEKSKQFENVALGANTIARRVADMGENIVTQIAKNASKFRHFSIAMDESLDSCSTSQLLVFIRGVDEDMNITQELASLHSMYGTVTGEDIFNELKKTFADYNLDWTNLSCLTVDGGKNMSGIKKGLVGQVKQMCNEKNILQPMFLHCIIHQQALCAKYVDISSVLNPVVKMVNLIRSHGLNHRQFRDMLKDTDTESQDLPYYTAVRWLSCEKVLSRVFKLRKEIGDFLESKGKPQPLMSDEEWVWKLAFAADITSHLNFLNLKLQGEENLVSDLYTHLKAFRSKLVLFLEQVQANNLTHFQQCKVFMAEATAEFPTSFACEIIKDLQLQFQQRFSDLDSKAEEVRLFQNPFEADVASCPDELQLEVIELQANDLLRDKFKEGLVGFYQFLPKEDFPNVKTFASRYLSIFGTTYLCEQTFSRMKYVKNNLRTNLSDDNLRSLLMLGTSNLKPEMSAILASRKQFHHSH